MTTSFQAFKFIELYSLIQFYSNVLLYLVDSQMLDTQFLYIDLIALIPLSIFSAWTGPYPTLNKNLPTATLFYAPVLISVIMSATIQFAFQTYFFFDVTKQVFYVPPFNIGGDNVRDVLIVGFEETVLFQLTNFQYLITCCAFLVSYPFRKPFYTNLWFMVFVVATFVMNTLFIVLPASSPICKFFGLQQYTGDVSYKWNITIGIVLNAALTYTAEKVISKYVTSYFDE